MCKQNGQITTHLSDELQLAVKNLAYHDDCKPSEWVRNLIEREVKNRYLQAKNTMQAVGHLQNDEILQNEKNGENR